MALPLLAAAGAVLGGGGAFLQGKAGDIARQRILEAANLAPLDIDSIVSKNLETQNKMFPEASALGRLLDEYNAQQALTQLERMIPGYGATRDKYMSNVQSDMAGQISPDVEQAIFRAGAGRALMQGQAGGVRHRGLVARDLGTTSDAIRQRGQAGFLAGVSTLPKISPLDILRAGFMGPTSQEALAIREKERAMQQQIMLQAAGVKGMTGAFGDYLSNLGGMLAGGGIMGGFGAKPTSTPYMGMAPDTDPSWA